MAGQGTTSRARATGDLLCTLLATRIRYVRAWQVHGRRQRGQVNQRAVARVLAEYLWEIGEVDETDRDLPNRLKNQVFRAFKGQRLTGELLEHFIGAFDMDEQDQTELWVTFTGRDAAEFTIRNPRAMGKPQWHRTVALFEHWFVDASGILYRRRVVQCIEAKEDGVDSYLFNREPQATQINVVHGGRVGRHYEYGDGLLSDDILLDASLLRGQRAGIEYEAAYESEFRPMEVRRPARGRTENVTLSVHFDPSRLPRRTWFAVWEDHYLGGPVRDELVDVSFAGTASHCLHHIEQTVVGFRWQW